MLLWSLITYSEQVFEVMLLDFHWIGAVIHTLSCRGNTKQDPLVYRGLGCILCEIARYEVICFLIESSDIPILVPAPRPFECLNLRTIRIGQSWLSKRLMAGRSELPFRTKVLFMDSWALWELVTVIPTVRQMVIGTCLMPHVEKFCFVGLQLIWPSKSNKTENELLSDIHHSSKSVEWQKVPQKQ